MPAQMEMDQLLAMMEGHRRLTLRTIEAFPERDLFHYTPTAPLRPFGEMVGEILAVERAFVQGIATGRWEYREVVQGITTKPELLAACESVRRQTREWWPQITVERLQTVEPDPLFGGPPQRHLERLLYAVENEIHHRGQGYVYLRMLGIEPPLFYER